MSTFDFRTLCVTALAGAGLFLYCQHVPTEGIDTHELAEWLVSEDPAEVQAGLAVLEAQRKGVFEGLIAAIRSSDHEVVRRGAQDLAVIVSPWMRGMVASERSWGFSMFNRSLSSVESVSSSPEADACRDVVVDTLDRLIDEHEANSTTMSQWLPAILRLTDTLPEFGDDNVIDWAARKVASIKHRRVAIALSIVIDSYGNIPPALLPYLTLGRCGTMSPQEFEQLRKGQDAKEQEAFLKRALSPTLSSWNRVRRMNRDERIKHAIEAWRTLAMRHMQPYPGGPVLDTPMIQLLEPLIHIGPSALPHLRVQQDIESDINAKALWEYVLAGISGEEDPVLVRALFDGTRAQCENASAIVAVSGSKKWFKELSDLQIRLGFGAVTATRALISCHGQEAIPALEQALKLNPHYSTAKIGLEKLVARRDRETNAD